MTDYIQIVTTFPDRESLERVSEILMEQGLAACVQVVENMQSTYRWKGRVERATEYLCMLKTRAELFFSIEKVIKEHHPYEVPQIVSLPLLAISSDYESWLDEVIFVKNLDKKA